VINWKSNTNGSSLNKLLTSKELSGGGFNSRDQAVQEVCSMNIKKLYYVF
jgi:hypothetical protein